MKKPSSDSIKSLKDPSFFPNKIQNSGLNIITEDMDDVPILDLDLNLKRGNSKSVEKKRKESYNNMSFNSNSNSNSKIEQNYAYIYPNINFENYLKINLGIFILIKIGK